MPIIVIRGAKVTYNDVGTGHPTAFISGTSGQFNRNLSGLNMDQIASCMTDFPSTFGTAL